MSGHLFSRAGSLTPGAQLLRVHGRFFSLSVEPIQGPASCWTCVVSRKVAQGAVDRNRIKRWCREAVRARVKKEKPRALIFRAKATAARAIFAEIDQDVADLLSRIPN